MTSAIKIILPLIITALFALSTQAKTDDFDIIKKRVVTELMKTPVEDSHVEIILARMKTDGSFQDINYDDLSRTAGFPHRRHTSDLLYMAKAYKTRTSKFYRSRKLKEQIITSLKYWVGHDFFGDNWHDNQISTPTNLVNFMLVIGDELGEDLVKRAQPIIGRANMNASGARPSGDRLLPS